MLLTALQVCSLDHYFAYELPNVLGSCLKVTELKSTHSHKFQSPLTNLPLKPEKYDLILSVASEWTQKCPEIAVAIPGTIAMQDFLGKCELWKEPTTTHCWTEKNKQDLVDSLVLLYLCLCCYCRREFINSSYLEVSENNTMTELKLHNSNFPPLSNYVLSQLLCKIQCNQ